MFLECAPAVADDGTVIATLEEQQLVMLRLVIESVRTTGKFDPVWETQVLCACNDSSPVSRKPLNAILQAILNPPRANRPDTGGRPFRLADKIICLKNSFMSLWEAFPGNDVDPTLATSYLQSRDDAGSPAEAFIANGDVGRVLAVSPQHVVVRFMWPDRCVRIDVRKPKATEGQGGDTTNGAGGTVGDFDLAYALTVHKSQGSEYRLVIILVDDSGGAGMVTSRNHHYTAISRGRELTLCIGRRATLDRQCRKDALAGRKTFLAELIREITCGEMAGTDGHANGTLCVEHAPAVSSPQAWEDLGL